MTGEPVPEARRRAGSFADMIHATVAEAWNGPWTVVDAVEEGAPLPRPGETGGVIVTGSPARIAEQRPWMRRAQRALRALVESGVPVLGICFGHQLLGKALGGDAGPNPRGREIGTVELDPLGVDPLVAPDGRGYPVSVTHLDVVLELPPGAEPVARTGLDPLAAIRFAERAWGVQFHPEMDGSIMADYILALRDAVAAEGLAPDALLAARADTPHAARVLRRFARLAAGAE